MASRITGRKRRKLRIRKKVNGTADRPRLTVYRSARHIYAQVIDDTSGRTLASASTMSKELRAAAAEAAVKPEAKPEGEAKAEGEAKGKSQKSKKKGKGAPLAGKLLAANKVGTLVAQRCKEQSIGQVVFDRNGYLYHGRVRALAEAARKGGLDF